MFPILVGISALTLLTALAILSRLHTLKQAITGSDLALTRAEAEAKFLRTQVQSLQEKLLAVMDPGAQARLYVQEHPQEKPPSEPTPRIAPYRNPMQIEVPPAWQDPNSLGPIDWDAVAQAKE